MLRVACTTLSVLAAACGAPSASSSADAPAGAHSGGGGERPGDPAPVADAGSADSGRPEAPKEAGTCPSAPRTDRFLAQRAACAFTAGTHASSTLDLSSAEREQIPIKHVIVVMKENRSFDHIFGGLKALQPDVDVADTTFTNNDDKGAKVPFFHLPTTCESRDGDHQWAGMHAMVNGGKMDGFVTTAAASTGSNGHFAMGHYEQSDLPFYYFLASTFAVADRYFPSVRSGTFPNRDYLLLGTSDGVTATEYSTWPSPSLKTIFEELHSVGVSWGVYADDFPFEGALDNPANDWVTMNPWGPVSKIVTDIEGGALPAVSFVDGRANVDDEHPTADLQVGEAWTKRIYDAVVASKEWKSTVILLTYDEAGGFADHVSPGDHACIARPQDTAFFELGVRVPLVVISPWARRHYVSHVPKEHTSITRFIETVFDLPAMTARDANSDALLDMFDFECPPAEVPEAPAAGKNGCGFGTTLALDKKTYKSGDSITVTFKGGPGNPGDWITVYPTALGPQTGPTLWAYCATGTHAGSMSPVGTGSVVLGPASGATTGSWPLRSGSWTAYYLVTGGYAAAASESFTVE